MVRDQTRESELTLCSTGPPGHQAESKLVIEDHAMSKLYCIGSILPIRTTEVVESLAFVLRRQL